MNLRAYRTIWLTGVALLLLLALTVGLPFVGLRSIEPITSLVIAGIKAVLIAIIFMHLYRDAPMVRLFAIAALLWFGILMCLTLSDYMTRESFRPNTTNHTIQQSTRLCLSLSCADPLTRVN